MNDLKELWRLYKKNPVMLAATFAGMVVGAVFGVCAYYGGWLG